MDLLLQCLCEIVKLINPDVSQNEFPSLQTWTYMAPKMKLIIKPNQKNENIYMQHETGSSLISIQDHHMHGRLHSRTHNARVAKRTVVKRKLLLSLMPFFYYPSSFSPNVSNFLLTLYFICLLNFCNDRITNFELQLFKISSFQISDFSNPYFLRILACKISKFKLSDHHNSDYEILIFWL